MISTFYTWYEHIEAIFKYPFGLFTSNMPSLLQASHSLSHWAPHHAWVDQRWDTDMCSTYMSNYEALPTRCTLAWLISELDQWYFISQSFLLLWGSVYRAYLEIQTSDWWFETCSRLSTWFHTWFHFQIPDIYTFIWDHILQVDQYIEQVIIIGHGIIHCRCHDGFIWTSYSTSSSLIHISRAFTAT